MPEALYSIQRAADLTGLSPHVIRIWERRYQAVTPVRTQSARRQYSDEQIERLRLLRQVTETGHTIGSVARLPTERLRSLLLDAGPAPGRTDPPEAEGVAEDLLVRALEAVKGMDAPALDTALQQAAVRLGAQGVLQRLVAPLAHAIGERWRSGAITAAHEHFATAVLRLFLGHAARPFASNTAAPVLVVSTPSGQLHELGVLMVGASAANLGWRVVYLGPSLAAAEIAGAVRQHQARVLALSIVYPEDDPALPGELARLRELLPDTAIIVGGRAASAYHEALVGIRAHSASDLNELGLFLDRLRRQR